MAAAYSSHRSVHSVLSLFLALAALVAFARAQLSPTFYASSCPAAVLTIRTAVRAAVALDARSGGSLLRLHFHDCFVQGCDASVLLDDTANFTGEKGAGPNAGSLRGFGVIDAIKVLLEVLCPRTVSCADILAVAARESVVALGGPSWKVQLGRRDSTTASLSTANTDLPSPASSLSTLLAAFARKGLSSTDMVALSGAHTVGQTQCQNFRAKIYNETNIDGPFAASRRASCPATGGGGALAPLDASTPNAFDNAYYGDLIAQRGLLHSDQQLFSGSSTDGLVRSYAASPAQFRSDFAAAMVRMGDIGVLTGSSGQVRRNCRRVN
ncbi:peroxidase 70-like [Phragmites australis]|uniref:peroxidase 70-like n=1 Tax=Phragmites australis TaxID=29695 RepID=UPI002D769C4D|nr:peroxidase 70-like [Phragmites australis]